MANDEDGEDRGAIMRRRSAFIVSAIAGVGLATSTCDPKPCLNMAQPCLSAHQEPPDAGPPDASADADANPTDGARDAGTDPNPQVCLSVVPPTPTPCLSPPAPTSSTKAR